MKPSRLLLYSRPGFERECAQEITSLAGEMGVEGFVKARPESAFAAFAAHQDDMGADLARHVEFARLVFPRQIVRVLEPLMLAESDRVAPIVAAARVLGRRFAALWIEMPDTNDGKALSTLTRPLAPHLERGLKNAGIEFDDEAATERLHVFFVGSLACYVGVSDRSKREGAREATRTRDDRGRPRRIARGLDVAAGAARPHGDRGGPRRHGRRAPRNGPGEAPP